MNDIDPATPAHWHPPEKSRLHVAAIVALALVAICILLWLWNLPPFRTRIVQTDNAYVRGRTTVIAPQVSGYVVEVAVADFARVQRGQVLARIDDRIYRAKLQQAHANLAAQEATLANSDQSHAARVAMLASQTASSGSAEAQLRRAKADMARADDLVEDGSVSIRERDQTLAALRQTEAQVRQALASIDVARQDVRTIEVGRDGLKAQVEAATAQVRLAEIDLENTVIRAPETGQVGEVGVRLGQYVTNGTQLLALVPDERWVVANYKEAQTADIAVGQSASFKVDALAGLNFTGHVENLSPATGSEFAVLKPDNATGNFVKVPQRIGVRIALDHAQRGAERLRPGMSVDARIDTGSTP